MQAKATMALKFGSSLFWVGNQNIKPFSEFSCTGRGILLKKINKF
jgi:hypothetical protein